MVYTAAMTWTVYLTRKAHKQLAKLPRSIQDLADLAVADSDTGGRLTDEPSTENPS